MSIYSTLYKMIDHMQLWTEFVLLSGDIFNAITVVVSKTGNGHKPPTNDYKWPQTTTNHRQTTTNDQPRTSNQKSGISFRLPGPGHYTFVLQATPFLGLTLGLFSKFTFSRLKVALELLSNFHNFYQFLAISLLLPVSALNTIVHN